MAAIDSSPLYAYTYSVAADAKVEVRGKLPIMPCACANLRRAARAVTRLYNHELRATGLEVTQFTLLMTLDLTGKAPQGELGKVLALDTTTLTRMLRPLLRSGWVAEQRGRDRRQRLLSLTASGRQKLSSSRPHWERAQMRLRRRLGTQVWNQMGGVLTAVAHAPLGI